MGGLTLVTMLTIGTALAAIPNTTAHYVSSQPMIPGSVVTVLDLPLMLLLGLLVLGITGLVVVIRELWAA